jgi:four helix bundle suffix protein
MPHGGYRKLRSFQIARLAYDLTARFCALYIDKFSRTHDQMIQAARSGVQNIAEGSMAAGTSKKIEMKLTGIARASLEELRLDYEDFLRQRGMEIWDDTHPAIRELRRRKILSAQDIRRWISDIKSEEASLSNSFLAAQAAITLIAQACLLLERQLAAQAKQFETEGGFTERMHCRRTVGRFIKTPPVSGDCRA